MGDGGDEAERLKGQLGDNDAIKPGKKKGRRKQNIKQCKSHVAYCELRRLKQPIMTNMTTKVDLN